MPSENQPPERQAYFLSSRTMTAVGSNTTLENKNSPPQPGKVSHKGDHNVPSVSDQSQSNGNLETSQFGGNTKMNTQAQGPYLNT